jgi:hypothetical protein
MPIFDERRTATMVRDQLLDSLRNLQMRILLRERFGADMAEPATFIARLGGVDSLDEMLARHAELVRQIRAISAAIDQASEVEMRDFVSSRINSDAIDGSTK